MSYQNLMDTKLIIKHSKAVMDDMQPGARTRNISGLFVENQDGERFKYPFIHLAGARAMQRHVANGGVPYDDIGQSIIKMSEEIAQLKSFGNYVVRNDLMNSETNSVVERSSAYLNSLREQIRALSKQSHYEAYRENFQAQSSEEIPQDVVEDFKEKFTVRSFKEDIATVFPVLYRLMKEGNTIGYDDIVAMTQQDDLTNEDVEIDLEDNDPFAKFENWVMALGEDSAIVSQDPEEQAAAIRNLQELVSEVFPAGVDGTNAIESLKGIIEDPALYNQIKETAKQNADADVRQLVQDWINENAPETLEQLDFGDIEDPMAYADQAADADAEFYGRQESIEEAMEKPVQPINSDYGYDGTNWDEWKNTKGSGYEDYVAAMREYIVADKRWRAQEARKYDTTLYIMNPHFDINDDDSPEELEVGVDYNSETSGRYYAQTEIDPAEYPETEYDVKRVVDLDTGADYSKDQEIIDAVNRKLNDEQYESIKEGPNKSDVPAYLRKQKGEEPLTLKDIEKEKSAGKLSHKDTLAKNRGETDEGREEQQSGKMNVQELAEFITSFYDKESGTFPKGPEGVCTMVGKKFGEQAEHVARKFVERMAPQQSTEQNPELQELARIKELSGM